MPETRREFLVGTLAGSSALAAGAMTCSLSAQENTELDEARRKAAHRQRRVIYNNDGDDIWRAGADTVEKFLAVRHEPLVGTQVDSIYYCTTQSFNHFSHDTKVAEIFLSKGGSYANNNLKNFLEQETDGLRMSSQFARKHGLESIWTLRMNDIHDAWVPELRAKWKGEDPTRVMSTLTKSKGAVGRQRLWSLVDFEHPDVEPRMLAIIDEVLTNYDIDGIELDFMRAPFYFRTTFNGEPATDDQIAIMTSLVRKIRELVLRRSVQRRKAYLLAVRVPSTVTLSRKIGIDITSWLQEKLIDVMALSGGYVTFDQPVKELIELGHQHDVPVYPCLSRSGMLYRPPRDKGKIQPAEAWFGAAMRLWHDGADGIYVFNLFADADGPGFIRHILKTIGSPERLAKTTTMYAISDAGWWMPAAHPSKDAEDFSMALPKALKPNQFQNANLYVPEDLSGAAPSVAAELRIDFTGLEATGAPQIFLDTIKLEQTDGGKEVAGVRRFACPVPMSAIHQGTNLLKVKTEAQSAKLAGAELWIRR